MGWFLGEVEDDAVEKKVGVPSSVVDADDVLQYEGQYMRIAAAPTERSVSIT